MYSIIITTIKKQPTREYILHNPDDIERLAIDMRDYVEKASEVEVNAGVGQSSAECPPSVPRPSIILALQGDLGAGKTTFVKAFARTFGIKEDLSSPTFVIQKRYPIMDKDAEKGGFDNLIHIDAYRLDNGEALKKLGFEKLITSSSERNIICLEWPEIVADILHSEYVTGYILVRFEHIDMDSRKVTVETKV